MLTNLVRPGDGAAGTLQSAADLATEWEDREAVFWIDMENPTEEEVRNVDAMIDLDDEAWDDCLHGEQRPRIDEYEKYPFLVCYGLLDPDRGTKGQPRKLAVFCGDRFLLTVHREPLASIDRLRTRCRQHGAQLLQFGVDHLLYNILDAMAESQGPDQFLGGDRGHGFGRRRVVVVLLAQAMGIVRGGTQGCRQCV